MIINNLLNRMRASSHYKIRYFATHVKSEFCDERILSKSKIEWETSLPYKKIPGPSKMSLIKGFLPGGKYYKKQLRELQILFNNEYGNIVRMPGVFGKRDLILTYDPADFEKIYRTEGPSPVRKGLDAFVYYRKVQNPYLFIKAGGLIAEQGEDWLNFRKIVNPVMMQMKNLTMYIPKLNKVGDQFVERIRLIRDPNTCEVPSTFERDINLWTLESICVVALNKHLGLLNETKKNEDAHKLIEAMSLFFQLSYDLDIKPSLWKIIKTPKFYSMMKNLDSITELITKYIDDAIIEMKNPMHNKSIRSEDEKSILEKLLEIDKKIAIVMAMDLLFGGVDSSSSAFVACLLNLSKNPEKQKILFDELKTALPEKNSPLTNENMKNLPYLKACIKESLRLNPVTLGNLRTTGQDIVLKGYRIPKDKDMAMANVFLHKNDKHFPQGDKFIPERWLRSTKTNDNFEDNINAGKSFNPFAYLPFGFGPRSCIGRRLVSLEMEVGLIKIVRNFHVEFNYSHDNIFKTNVINVPNGDLKFQFYDTEI